MMYAVEMDSGAVMYVPSFIKTGSVIQKLLGGGGGDKNKMDYEKPNYFF
jgi:hypothetical protein